MLRAVVRKSLPVLLVATQLATLAFAGQGPLNLRVQQGDDRRSSLSLRNIGTFHSTPNEILDARSIRVPNSEVVIALWNERNAGGTERTLLCDQPGRQDDCAGTRNFV